jgi:hypothetical protein
MQAQKPSLFFVICSKQYGTQPLRNLYHEILWDFLDTSLLLSNIFNAFNLTLWTTKATGVYLDNFFLASYWSAGYFLLVTSLCFHIVWRFKNYQEEISNILFSWK